ncbi:MAG: rhomboid family intramembrane serine protease [Gemmatimonadales bacterium]|nr:MAG: rhomboid family intramembrane serine protease [Gemmatimonadales bacterium]
MTPWVLRLLLVNVFIFLITAPQLGYWAQMFGFRVVDIAQRPWGPITYMFLHGGLWHLAFNMIGLYFFGPRLEARLGGRHFLSLYFVAGLTGALFSLLTPFSLIIGASGAVLGVLFGFARYWPSERIYIMAILPMEARVLVIVFAVLSVGAGFMGIGGVAHFAHLGGFAGAWLYLVVMERNTPAEKFRRRVEAQAAPKQPTGRLRERWKEVETERLHPLNREEYERIMRKADTDGIASLTISERAFMERVVQQK